MISDTGDETTVTNLMKLSSMDVDHSWRFVTNHANVLTCIAADPSIRLKDVAESVGITERTAAQIVGELEEAGYLTKSRDGRRNTYEVHADLPLRHPQHRHHTVGDLIRFLQAPAETPDAVP
jgi:DNA-binding transcriptional ArsR family regulator